MQRNLARGKAAVLPAFKQRQRVFFAFLITIGKARQLVWRHIKACVDHPQRLKDFARQRFGQRLPRDHLDHPPDHINPHRILPARAGLKTERQPGKFLAPVCQRNALQAKLGEFGRIGLRHHTLVERIGHAAGMGEQLVQRGRAGGVCVVHAHSPGAQGAHRSKLGEILRDGRVQHNLSALQQHHEKRARHKLGHRIDPHKGVALIGLPARHGGEAIGGKKRLLTVAIDQEGRARVAPRRTAALHPCFNPLQPRFVHLLTPLCAPA